MSSSSDHQSSSLVPVNGSSTVSKNNNELDPIVLAAIDRLVAYSVQLVNTLQSYEQMLTDHNHNENQSNANELLDSDQFISADALSSFQSTFEQIVKTISHRATVVCMAFEGQPLPEGKSGEALVDSLRALLESFAQICVSWAPCALNGLPQFWTRSWLKQTKELGQCSVKFAEALKTTDSRRQLRETGSIWAVCECLCAKTSIYDVAIAEHNRILSLVQDAQKELMTDQSLTDQQTHHVLIRVVALCKCCVNCIKLCNMILLVHKVSSNESSQSALSTNQSASTFSMYRFSDQLNRSINEMSELIDNLAAAFYEFDEEQTDQETAKELVKCAREIGFLLRRILEGFILDEAELNEELRKKVELVRDAVNHNLDALYKSHPTIETGFEELN